MEPTFSEPPYMAEDPDDQAGEAYLDDDHPEDALSDLERAPGEAPRDMMPDAIAEAVFDLLSHLALNPNTAIDEGLVESFAHRHGLETADLSVDTYDGPWNLLDIFELEAQAPADAVEGVNSLFAQGLAIRLAPLREGDRKRLLARVVGLLPGIERLGPFSPSALLPDTCASQDVIWFWEAYADRLLAEMNKRASADADEATHPWVLPRLLDMERARIGRAHGSAWPRLIRHLVRLLDQAFPQAAVVQRMLAGCRDEEVLHFLGRSPALADASGLIATLITEGERQVIGCGLLALHTFPTLTEEVDEALAALELRPLETSGPRLLDIHGQISCLDRPGPALARLQEGINRIMISSLLAEGDPMALVKAVSKDARAFVQSALLLSVDDALGRLHPQLTAPLIERIISVFYQSFTPSGIKHPYNDERWQESAARALARMIRADPEGTLTRAGNFGLALDGQAQRWIPGEDRDSRAQRSALACSFLGLYGQVVSRAARLLYRAEGARRQGLATYGVLVRVYRTHQRLAMGSGLFGALEFLWVDRGFNTSMAGIEEDARTLAELEGALWPEITEQSPSPVALPVLEVPASRAMVAAHQAMGAASSPLVRPMATPSVEASAWLIGRPGGWWRTMWGIYSGWDLAREWGRRLGRWVGVRRQGWLTLGQDVITIAEESRLGSRVFSAREYIQDLSALEAVEVQRQLKWPYAVAGLLSLVVAGAVGGHLAFLGLRVGQGDLAGVGVGLVLAGILADMGWMALYRRHRGRITLALRSSSAPRWTRIMVDPEEAGPILDALVTYKVGSKEGGEEKG